MSSKGTISVIQRAILLKTTSKMNLSAVSQRKIGEYIASLDRNDREAKAKEINERLLKCKTKKEAEAIADDL